MPHKHKDKENTKTKTIRTHHHTKTFRNTGPGYYSTTRARGTTTPDLNNSVGYNTGTITRTRARTRSRTRMRMFEDIGSGLDDTDWKVERGSGSVDGHLHSGSGTGHGIQGVTERNGLGIETESGEYRSSGDRRTGAEYGDRDEVADWDRERGQRRVKGRGVVMTRANRGAGDGGRRPQKQQGKGPGKTIRPDSVIPTSPNLPIPSHTNLAGRPLQTDNVQAGRRYHCKISARLPFISPRYSESLHFIRLFRFNLFDTGLSISVEVRWPRFTSAKSRRRPRIDRSPSTQN